MNSGTCTTGDGQAVGTYEIFGQWKKISGYTTPRTKEQLELDFDLLIVRKGNLMCNQKVVNGVFPTEGRWNYLANYTHDIPKKSLDLEAILAVNGRLPSLTPDTPISGVTYSFSGSCSKTQMKLRLPGMSASGGTLVETYELYSKTIDEEDCIPQSE
jgi:hypothetical protein